MMATWIKCTNLTSQQTYVNLDLAFGLLWDDAYTCTIVGFPGSDYRVKETPDELLRRGSGEPAG
jgi:hypothetical protein